MPPKSVYHIIYQGNVLLDSEFHCQITDFGSTRHFEAAVTQSTTAFAINFVAPELLGMCTTCGLSNCNGCQGNQAGKMTRKTMATDVYAFGCIYSAVRMDPCLIDALPIQDLCRHSLILLLFMTSPTIKLFDLSQMESARIDWKVREWKMIHGISFRNVGSPFLLNVRR